MEANSIIETLDEAFEKYIQGGDDPHFEVVTQSFTDLWLCRASLCRDSLGVIQQIMLKTAHKEALWGMLAGQLIWSIGDRTVSDFNNIWNCARYAGIESKFSRQNANFFLKLSANASPAKMGPTYFIMRGNALRQLQRFAEAESAYIVGADMFPDYPFSKFRLIDLYLITYRLEIAKTILSSLFGSYPYALEMMFAMPYSLDSNSINMPHLLSPEKSEYVWLVAADSVYIEKYATGFVEHAIKQTQAKAFIHFHVVRDEEDSSSLEIIKAIGQITAMCSTERTIKLSDIQVDKRKAIFASERFLLIADLLEKYSKPIIVTDIDVDCLRDPYPLFDKIKNADIGLTSFGEIRDAWDKYPATVIVVNPTDSAIKFFKSMSSMIVSLLKTHRQPWFVDQVALYRMIEEGIVPIKLAYLDKILTDTNSPHAYFRLLHGSWQN